MPRPPGKAMKVSAWLKHCIHSIRYCDNLLSFLDQAVEQEVLTSSAPQIIIYAATAEQLIDQLQSFIPVIDPSMSRINWSTKESRKKLRLDLSLHL